jgi:hypothetical protein
MVFTSLFLRHSSRDLRRNIENFFVDGFLGDGTYLVGDFRGGELSNKMEMITKDEVRG